MQNIKIIALHTGRQNGAKCCLWLSSACRHLSVQALTQLTMKAKLRNHVRASLRRAACSRPLPRWHYT